MSDRRSAIADCDVTHPGPEGAQGLIIRNMGPVTLHQAAAWPGRMEALGATLSPTPPPPGRVAVVDRARLFRAEPLVWHLLDGPAPQVDPDLGTALELSHGRALIRVEGAAARDLMMRQTVVDLRDAAFPDGSVALTGGHHVPWTLLRGDGDGPAYEVLIMRSYAQDFWDRLLEAGAQFGYRAMSGAAA